MKSNEIQIRRTEIAAFLSQNDIHNYEMIDADLTINVNGNVNLSGGTFTNLPVKFGHVTGNFGISSCKELISLDGAPISVGGYFDLTGCDCITSFEGFNTKINGWLRADATKIKSGGIAIILSRPRSIFMGTPPFDIIKKYIDRPEDIFECQAELIEAGYAEYARL